MNAFSRFSRVAVYSHLPTKVVLEKTTGHSFFESTEQVLEADCKNLLSWDALASLVFVRIHYFGIQGIGCYWAA